MLSYLLPENHAIGFLFVWPIVLRHQSSSPAPVLDTQETHRKMSRDFRLRPTFLHKRHHSFPQIDAESHSGQQ